MHSCHNIFMTIGEKADCMKSWIKAMFPFYLLATVFITLLEHLLHCHKFCVMNYVIFTCYHFPFAK